MFNKFKKQLPTYTYTPWCMWDYSTLNESPTIKSKSNKDTLLYSRLIITADTETSKAKGTEENHVVIWALHVQWDHILIVTLYGRKPSDFVKCLTMLKDNIPANKIYCFFHNLGYDWVFLRKFLLKDYGKPEYQLNLKPHCPLLIEFMNGVIFRDSLPLAQRRLAKWAEDLHTPHKKQLGDWNYNVIRNQNSRISKKNHSYMEGDVVALGDCIQATMDALNCNITTLPYTATGILRRDLKYIGKKNKAKQKYLNCLMSYETYRFAENVYHGGYCHGNRFFIDTAVYKTITCYDFSSSYPARLILSKYPVESFEPITMTAEEIIDAADNYAFMFTLCIVKPELKRGHVMPLLQLSKCERVLNPVVDNGRLLEADYVEIPITELDLILIMKQYDYINIEIKNCVFAEKDYLPRWLTDYIYKLYDDKCRLKTGDPVAYNIQKSKINAAYGCHVQKCVRLDDVEDYDTGMYYLNDDPTVDGYIEPRELYEKYTKKWGTILPYQWGVYCTAAAMFELFALGDCIDYSKDENGEQRGQWLYSDTDSCYGYGWDVEKIQAYNENIEKQLKARGYDPIYVNGKKYVIGAAEPDGVYKGFKCEGAKRYVCIRQDDTLKVTVAGVPKARIKDDTIIEDVGAICLKNNIDNFTPGFIFSGKTTGKLQHTYIFTEAIHFDENGNEIGDSIDLNPADYTLDTAYISDWDTLFTDDEGGLPYYG